MHSDYFEKTIKSDMIFNGNVLNLRVDEILLPDGRNSTREIIEHNGGVGIVAVKSNKIVLVSQFRKPLNETILEIPAGKIDGSEDPYKCGMREMEEETGLIPQNLELLTTIYPAPGYSSEKLYIYYTSELAEGKIDRDDDEFLDVHNFEIAEV
jgi:ADP-ribose pyrophosphatase